MAEMDYADFASDAMCETYDAKAIVAGAKSILAHYGPTACAVELSNVLALLNTIDEKLSHICGIADTVA